MIQESKAVAVVTMLFAIVLMGCTAPAPAARAPVDRVAVAVEAATSLSSPVASVPAVPAAPLDLAPVASSGSSSFALLSEGDAGCECVVYIQNAFRLSILGRVMYARDMAGYLTSPDNGFAETDNRHGIQQRAIAVFQPSFGHGVYPEGHVAWIAGYSFSQDGRSVTIIFRGSNQPAGTNLQSGGGCNNVSDWTITYPPDSGGIAYFNAW